MTSKTKLINYIHAKQRETPILVKNHLKDIDYSRLKFNEFKNHIDNFIVANGEYYNRFFMMSGLRGVGKTTVLYQLYEYLTKEKNVSKSDIFYLDVHDLKTSYDVPINDIVDLYLEDIHGTTAVNLNKKIFLFVDEAQLDIGWVNYAKLLFDKTFNIFMIFTGSSALNLEINADASRRIMKEQLFPCNFSEYLIFNYGLNLTKNNFMDILLKRDESNIEKAIECESLIKKDLLELNNDPEIILKKFLHYGAFPFSFKMTEVDIHRLTNDLIERIVQEDLRYFASFNKVSNESILRLISYIATKKPGSTSNSALAQSLNLNIRTVNNILDALEKSQLIFSINAYGSAGKILNKPKQHFFLTPCLKSAINYRVGRYDLNHEKCYAVLAENMVASTLKRFADESFNSLGIFYDANKKGVDFIVKIFDNVVPIEVGVGKKTKSQLTRAKNRYSADYGVLVSNRTSTIEFKDDILYIPLISFSLIG